MHPPVSNGIQGAYFAAACVTGLIAGALAVTFPDITEGLGLFLGGFCLSMWFLVLKSGGLITSTAGKIIFIACFTIGAFTFYISHHTRPYGIIGASSIAGATIVVLGIDCFSRAGLKEFWLYIWSWLFYVESLNLLTFRLDLNNSIFPLDYSGPYPITRAIRVEVAAIIIITLIGVLSQMKVWQIVKKRKEERAAEQRKRDHERDLSDEEQGRKVEDENHQDRPLWERMHGSKDKAKVSEQFLDSGVGTDEPGSTRKGSLSDAEGMEMQDLKGSQHGYNIGGRVTVHVAQDDFHEISLDSVERSADSMHKSSGEIGGKSGVTDLNQCNAGLTLADKSARNHMCALDPSLTSGPKVVPPPFNVPEVDSSSDDDSSSMRASIASDYLPNRPTKRLSGSSIIRRLSKGSRKRSYVAGSTSDEALMIRHIEDDRASSQAVAFDGLSDKNLSSEDSHYSRGPSPTLDRRNSQASLNALVAAAHNMRNSTSDPDQVHVAEAVPLPQSRPTSVTEAQQINPIFNKESEDPKSTPSEASRQRTVHQSLAAEFLPSGGSKVVTAYRTNEWAKHLDGAETPEIDEVRIRGLANAEITQGEGVAPVNTRALQQTAFNAEPAPVFNHTASLPSAAKQRSSGFMPRNSFSKKQEIQKSQPALHPLIIAKQIERAPSQTSLAKNMSRTSSQTSLDSNGSRADNYRPPIPKFRSSQISIPPMRNHRSSSTPLTSPLVESPIEEGVESSFSSRFTPQATHLMSQRDRIITSKPSSTSLLRTSYSNVALDQHPAYRTLEGNDDISLAQRKSLLQQNPQQAHFSIKRYSSGPLGTSSRRKSDVVTPNRTASGNSTPQRLSSGPHPQLYPIRPAMTPHDSTISAWRTSLQQNVTATYKDHELERRRSEMLREKQREDMSKQEQQLTQGRRTSVLDKGMRRGDMIQAHKEAMRRMQEGVKL